MGVKLSNLELKRGLKVPELEHLYRIHGSGDCFANVLLALLEHAESEVESSWLLKKHIEETGAITPELEHRILHALPKAQHWEAALHILQMIPYLSIAQDQAPQIRDHLLILKEHDNKFVRAWTYNALHALQNQHPEYSDEIMPMLDSAYGDEAPSVKARIRQLLKPPFSSGVR